MPRKKPTARPKVDHTDLATTLHIGASSVSMQVVQRSPDGCWMPLEFLEKPAPLARDIFSRGMISNDTTERIVSIIRGYQKALGELGIAADGITRAAATNIVTEAANHEAFINRIRIACGLRIGSIDDGEMTRLIYLKTRRRLQDIPTMRKDTTLVVHVGPGNTRALLFRNGRITRYTSYRMGTHRTREAVDATHTEGSALLRVIREHVYSNLTQIRQDYADTTIGALVVIGSELQSVAAALLDKETSCPVSKLRKITREAATLSDVGLVKRFQLDYQTAEALLPALEVNLAIAEMLGLDRVHIPASGYEQGLLQDLLVSREISGDMPEEVLRSARILAKRYQSDPSHGEHVRDLCVRLFSELADLHQLGTHDRLLLELAAILHEVGTYVNARAHHRHSEYLILNSEIFGLDRLDVTMVALIARYHRHALPVLDHPLYANLDTDHRIRVCKLAAILRVADALERTHAQRISRIAIERSTGKLTLRIIGLTDATVERLAMASKANLFEQVFGLTVAIEEGRRHNQGNS